MSLVNRYQWGVILIAAGVFLLACISPPGLMDDVDAVQAQIARTMLETGDWITPHLNKIAYMEKPPMKYWLIASFFSIFGVHDWVARLPIALGAVTLAWVVFLFGKWTLSERAGFQAGLAIASCIGLFLFTRILIADVLIALTITTSLWCFLRIIDDDEPHPLHYSMLGASSIGFGILLKGLIAFIFPIGIAGLYLIVSRQILEKRVWQRVNLPVFILVLAVIVAPWHILATIKNPPYFDFSMVSEPGKYRGFFWFYFFNEHILRFLGRRHPKDYNTVPLVSFWLLNLVWLFPWSSFLPSLRALDFTFTPKNRLQRVCLLAICWIATVMGFFSLSTTQEYYSMPIYPAVALLVGLALDKKSELPKFGLWLITIVCTLASIAIISILYLVKDVPVSGDISNALAKHEDVYNVYTLSLGHFGDLTLNSFAYLKLPLVMALISMLLGLLVIFFARKNRDRACVILAVMMIIFFQAAHQALVVFEPYLGSRPLAEALVDAPKGLVIFDNQYYTFSSVFFYAHPKEAVLLNGRINNLEYGSYAPGAPDVFIDETEFKTLWAKPDRCYLLVEKPSFTRLQELVGKENFYIVYESGGKLLLTNTKL